MRDYFVDIKGTLMHKNVPLFNFIVGKTIFVPTKVLCDDWNEYPFEFYYTHEIDEYNFKSFMKGRITPLSRVELGDVHRACGIKTFNWDDMAKYNNGLSISDDFWIRFNKRGPQTYEELLEWAGLTYKLEQLSNT